MVLNHSYLGVSVLVICLIAGCDSVPSPVDETNDRPPLIEQFSISPQTVVFALLDEESITGDSVNISLSINAQVQITGSQVSKIDYAILSPDTLGQPIRTGSLAFAQNGRYIARVNLTLNAFEVKSYPVIIYVIDANNQLGGEARTMLDYARSFEPISPPVIEKLNIPSTIQRPASGQPSRLATFEVEVSDPEGLNDIESVEFWNITTPSSRLLLCDDGNQHRCGNSEESGDAQARDGIYTRTVFILGTNDLGVNTFVFEATDRSGLRSEQVLHTIEIIE